jgi:hypothetical protein
MNMGKVVSFNGKKRKLGKVKDKRKYSINQTIQGTTFMDMVEQDAYNLAEATGKTKEEAVKIASDFYRKYPMLIEYVRSPEYMLRNK